MAHDIKISYEPSINSKAMAISLVVYFSWYSPIKVSGVLVRKFREHP